MWVRDERSVDAFHKNGPHLFYVYERNFMNNKIETWIWTQGQLADELKKKVPEITAATPMSWGRTNNFMVGDKAVKEDGFCANASFFSIFSYPLLAGTAADALSAPGSIAISRKMATELYGSPLAAMGKSLKYENTKDLTVKAVFEDVPANVSSPFNYIMSWPTYLEDNPWALDWNPVDPRTVIQLRPDADPAAVERKLTHFLDGYPTANKTNIRVELGLQRFDQNYLYGAYNNGHPSGTRIAYVRLFSLVALFILLIACINFMNLTTARSIYRGKEIGIRKVVGAKRSVLRWQFIGEALLLTGISMMLALLIVALTLPFFNLLTGKQIVLPLTAPLFWAALAGLVVVTGTGSGIYPAFFLSAFQPIRVLRGSLKTGAGAVWLRKGLVVFQFVLSISLIIATLLISRQVRFLQSANLGYDRENLLYMPLEGALQQKTALFTGMAARLPGVQSV
ncbi:MAG TPA: ABC transporter permease, partial [Chitinophaga sp.]